MIGCLAFSLSTGVQAQLILDKPGQRWAPGETIELYMPRQDDGQQVRIEAVLFGGRQVPFDLMTPRSRDEVVRVRLRVPAGVKPGPHQISAVFSETTLAAVPAVLGLSVEEARRALGERGLGLDAGPLLSEGRELDATTISRQSPVAGARVRPGAVIAVTTTTEVPDIVDLSIEEARSTLEPRGLELDTTLIVEVPAPLEALRVVRYVPASGVPVVTGSLIQVQEVAVGVPDLLGRGIHHARQTLLDAGLVPLVDLHAPAAGPYEAVLTQQPAADTAAAPGSGVRLAAQSRPDPPGPRWPLPELAAVVVLTATLRRMRARRAPQQHYEIVGHTDIDRLRTQSTARDLEGRGSGFDLRLVAVLDSGRQTLAVDGSLIAREVP